jgi:hypothetical protein
MNVLNDLNNIMIKETKKVLRELFENDEKTIQDIMSSAIQNRGVNSNNPELDDEDSTTEAEDEEGGDKKKKKKSLDDIMGDIESETSNDKQSKTSGDSKKEPRKQVEPERQTNKNDASGVKQQPRREKEEEETVDRRKFNTKWTADSDKFDDQSSKPMSQLKFDDIKTAMDLFRGGKSTDNPDVKKHLEKYVEQLSLAEKQAMYAFFMAAAQILSGRASEGDALEPKDIGVKMSTNAGENNHDKESRNSNIDKTQKKSARVTSDFKSSKPSGTSDNPIVVGEVANKIDIKKILSEINR